MFHTLETTWDQSARRRWTTLASFAMQALALSLLLAIPLLWVQGPPQLRWFDRRMLVPPSAAAASAPPPAQRPIRSSNMSGDHVLLPSTVPPRIAQVNDNNNDAPAAPYIGDLGVPGGFGPARRGVPGSTGEQLAIAPPPAPPPTRPIRVSHWAEGNLIYRVQPSYPSLARQARIQGSVELRAIISKNGTIENLTVVTGHAMLVASAIEAVKRWRYRPYLLNGEPVEVETEITVNFMLSGG